MKNKGFTLIEMMVSVALFSVVMMVSIGSLLALIDASKKAQGIQSVMNNLNVALDGMVRALRMGNDYAITHGGKGLSFTPFNKPGETWTYYFKNPTPAGSSEPRGRIYKQYNASGIGPLDIPITAKEVDIDDFKFYITGTPTTGDTLKLKQPRVMMIIRGKAGFEKAKNVTTFDIQASATQRLLDI